MSAVVTGNLLRYDFHIGAGLLAITVVIIREIEYDSRHISVLVHFENIRRSPRRFTNRIFRKYQIFGTRQIDLAPAQILSLITGIVFRTGREPHDTDKHG